MSLTDEQSYNLRMAFEVADKEKLGLDLDYESGGKHVRRIVSGITAPTQSAAGDWSFKGVDSAHPERTCSTFRVDRIRGYVTIVIVPGTATE